MHRGNIGPVVVSNDVNEDLCLVVVGGNDAQKIRKASLVAQISRGGRVANLRDAEQLQEVLYLLGEVSKVCKISGEIV